jgi:hypothetical protein
MSYDLFFKPRSGECIAPDAFDDFFSSRSNYKVDLPQAWYQNEETGVYFVFELHSDTADNEAQTFPVSLNINYFRPSYFILEAEPEVTAFVRHFDLVVSDPQLDGMGDGDYNPDLLKSGWNHGNAFGYSAILKDPENRPTVTCLPAQILLRSWAWNHRRNSLQAILGESKFVPRIIFLSVNGLPATAALWPDGIPIAVPEVDYFIVPRKELAPRKLFLRTEDHTVVAYKDALPILERYRSTNEPGFVLSYDSPPRDIAAFVKALPKSELAIQGVAADSMLDKELVERVV